MSTTTSTSTSSKPWYCYLLQATKRRCTYIGATVDPVQRLRKHNGEISGGAKYTTRRLKDGNSWQMVCYVHGFPDEVSALQFEWQWKHMARSGVHARSEAVKQLIERGYSTSKSVPYCNFESMGGYWPEVVWWPNFDC